jgi:hypothetical protein
MLKVRARGDISRCSALEIAEDKHAVAPVALFDFLQQTPRNAIAVAVQVDIECHEQACIPEDLVRDRDEGTRKRGVSNDNETAFRHWQRRVPGG